LQKILRFSRRQDFFNNNRENGIGGYQRWPAVLDNDTARINDIELRHIVYHVLSRMLH